MLFIQLAPISIMPKTRVIAATAPFVLFWLTLRQQRKQHAAMGAAICRYESHNILNLRVFITPA
jgi:hypothetical protein